MEEDGADGVEGADVEGVEDGCVELDAVEGADEPSDLGDEVFL